MSGGIVHAAVEASRAIVDNVAACPSNRKAVFGKPITKARFVRKADLEAGSSECLLCAQYTEFLHNGEWQHWVKAQSGSTATLKVFQLAASRCKIQDVSNLACKTPNYTRQV